MSLFGSLSAGVSGLISQGEAISVISDNLSNVNTIGYKGSKTLFAQLVTSSGISGTQYNAGGVATNIRRSQNIQGALQSTQSSTDLALSGTGFFVVSDNSEINNNTSYFYTRAGAFSEDNRGYLTLPAGQYLIGWKTNQDGVVQDRQNPRPIEIQTVGASAKATEEFNLGVNLTSTEAVYDYDTYDSVTATPRTRADNINDILADPTLANYVTDIRFFDSEGGSRDATVAFTKNTNNQWDWVMFTDGSNIQGGTAGVNVGIGTGTLTFNPDGSLKATTGETMSAATGNPILWSGGVEVGEVDINFGSGTGGLGFSPYNSALAANATATGMDVQNGVLGYTLDHTHPSLPSPSTGNYSFSYVATTGPTDPLGSVTLTDPSGATTTLVIPSGVGAKTLEFGNGITLTLSADFASNAATTPAAGLMGVVQTTSYPPTGTGTGTDGMIQFASSYNTLFSNQDGFGSGTLSSVTVDEDGFLIGSFTNGETKKLWKLVVAVFQNPSELDPVSQNLLRETDGSGPPLYKEAGIGGTASVVSGALEQSTVDIAEEFSNMIVSQRAYQASSTVVSTVDQMLNELMQLR